MARKKTHLVPCQEALVATDKEKCGFKFVSGKERQGGLIHANENIVKICCETEMFQTNKENQKVFPKHQPIYEGNPKSKVS